MNEDLKVGAGNPGTPGASKENQDTIPSLRRQPWKWWLQVIVSILAGAVGNTAEAVDAILETRFI